MPLKLLSLLSSAALAVTLGAAPVQAGASGHRSGAPATLAGAGVTTGAQSSVSTAAARGFRLRDRWAREITRYGDADSSVYSIEHVRELQYRLGWAGAYSSGVTGYFGDDTRAGVRRYQHREGLRVSGVAGHRTWKHLLRDTVRHRGRIRAICKTNGWHACYDRAMHQVTLWHNGKIRNTWLVRGGAYDTPTRVGNTYVYYRDIDHVSGLPEAEGSPMPYAQFFDGGQAYHGSGYLIDPFSGHSHGCINMYIEDARQLWRLTSNKRLNVSVYGRWG
ncbi:MAG: L,D-transpeptidase family protein [Nocardioidaceae bacterium]